MGLLDGIVEAVGPNSNNATPVYRALKNNAVQQSLQTAGYEFVYVGNWWAPARHNPYADVNFYGADDVMASLSEIESAFTTQTPLPLLLPIFLGKPVSECERLKNQLAFLKAARRETDKPVFVFAHLTMPHDPITMDRKGGASLK